MNYSIFWFRRDLRLEDNAGLYYALKSGVPIKPIFIFDKNILDQLPADDPRVTFIHDELSRLDEELKALDSGLNVYYGYPEEIWQELSQDPALHSVYTNRDYEQYALARDENVKQYLAENDKEFHDYKDHLIFDRDEILKKDGKPYTVFTPYKKQWLNKLEERKEGKLSYYFKSYPTEKYFGNFLAHNAPTMPTLEQMNFQKSEIEIPDRIVSQSVIKSYDQNRDFPAINGTSMLGIHYRFGTISIREKAFKASKINDVYLSELIWRDFYSSILYNFPHVEKGSFRPQYDLIEWRNNESDFDKWCKGMTGYPIVDAGMRELNATGYMHNRVRMIVASFLTKHLLIHWSWGAQYFAEKLLDFDLASNNGGWQWAAGSGTDAAPYFRVFNPYLQTEKFDKNLKYIKKWVPDLESPSYPDPIIEHKEARLRALDVYKKTLKK